MLLSAFLSLLIATAYAQTPSNEEYFKTYAVPAVLIDIAQCESNTQQFTDSGTLVRDSVTGDHVGLFQISLKLHSNDGYDITTPVGNIAEALFLYRKNGTKDWVASSECWSKKGGQSPPQ